MDFVASKVIIDEANERIMGTHVLGPDAGEAINIFAAVMRLGLKASDMKKMIFFLSNCMFGYSLYAVNTPARAKQVTKITFQCLISGGKQDSGSLRFLPAGSIFRACIVHDISYEIGLKNQRRKT